MSMFDFAGAAVRAVGGAARDAYQQLTGAIDTVAGGAAGAASGVVTGVADTAVQVVDAVPLPALMRDIVINDVRNKQEVALDAIELVKDFATPLSDLRAVAATQTIDRAGLVGTPASADVPLRPNQPAPISVSVAALRANSEVSRVLGRVYVGDAEGTPTPQRTTGTIERTGAELEGFNIAVERPRRPTNLTIALEGGATIWRGAGTLDQRQYDVPDFAAALNAWLDSEAPPSGRPVSLRLVAQSDSPGMVGFAVRVLDQYLLQAQLWPGAEGAAAELVRDIEYGQTLRLSLDAIADADAWREALTMQVSGTLGSDRVLGAVGDATVSETATVSGEYFVAQRIQVETPTSCTGVVARLSAGGEATLYAELCAADVDGLPVTATPLARGEATTATPASDTAMRWTAITFATPAMLAPGQVAWVVLRGVRGVAQLALERGVPGARVNRGGLVWRTLDEAHPDLGAQVRLLHRPDASSPIAALELRVQAAGTEARETARADPSPTAQTVDIPARIAGGAAQLVITSRARGQVRLSGVLQRYGLPSGMLRNFAFPGVVDAAMTLATDRIGVARMAGR